MKNLLLITSAIVSLASMASANDMGMMNHKGDFKSLHAPTTGSAKIAKNNKGQWILTISNLKTEAAPDLKVWVLAEANIKDTPELKNTSHTDLGSIASKTAIKSFVLPKDAMPDKINSVVLWCDQFSVAFASASLK